MKEFFNRHPLEQVTIIHKNNSWQRQSKLSIKLSLLVCSFQNAEIKGQLTAITMSYTSIKILPFPWHVILALCKKLMQDVWQCLSIYLSIHLQNQLTLGWCFLSGFHTKRWVSCSELQYQQGWSLRPTIRELALPCIIKSCSCLHSSSCSTTSQKACILWDVTLNFSTRRGMDTIQSTISCNVCEIKLVTALSEGSKLTWKMNAFWKYFGMLQDSKKNYATGN